MVSHVSFAFMMFRLYFSIIFLNCIYYYFELLVILLNYPFDTVSLFVLLLLGMFLLSIQGLAYSCQ